MHRDIKPENIPISTIIDEMPVIKLADFGLSVMVDAVNGNRSLNLL